MKLQSACLLSRGWEKLSYSGVLGMLELPRQVTLEVMIKIDQGKFDSDFQQVISATLALLSHMLVSWLGCKTSMTLGEVTVRKHNGILMACGFNHKVQCSCFSDTLFPTAGKISSNGQREQHGRRSSPA